MTRYEAEDAEDKAEAAETGPVCGLAAVGLSGPRPGAGRSALGRGGPAVGQAWRRRSFRTLSGRVAGRPSGSVIALSTTS
ncbi:hypothetical protein SAMN04489712_109232 [Thermomonospora echinospora]|uniref:Uncharacterized protein n=1 Tax=Thermomonospora echinospora TaxID=1992 RepID=A0A1H6CDW3_9ACTN|nr:hypothetical protein SAMN04489712_109232 [Thermomonospora echinospora]